MVGGGLRIMCQNIQGHSVSRSDLDGDGLGSCRAADQQQQQIIVIVVIPVMMKAKAAL